MNPQEPTPIVPNQPPQTPAEPPVIPPVQPQPSVTGTTPVFGSQQPVASPPPTTVDPTPVNPVMTPQNPVQAMPFGSVNPPAGPLSSTPQKSKKLLFVVLAVVLVSFMIGGVVLALTSKPTKKTDTNTTQKKQTDSKDDKTNQQDGLVCKEFVPDEFEVIVNCALDKTDGFFVTYKTKSGKYNIFFKYLFAKNGKNYDSPATVERSIQSVVRFNEQNKERKWSLSLSGSFAEDTEANRKLANERTEKVKTDLIKAGIPESRFVIKDAAKATSSGLNYINIDDRYVQAIIGANCT